MQLELVDAAVEARAAPVDALVLERALRALGAGAADPALAFRTLSGLLRAQLPQASVALLQPASGVYPAPAAARLLALTEAGGGQRFACAEGAAAPLLPTFDDACASCLLAEDGAAWVQLPAGLRATPTACLLGRPIEVLRIPLLRLGRVVRLLLVGTTQPQARLLLPPATGLLLAHALLADAAFGDGPDAVETGAGRRHEVGRQALAEVRDLVDVQRALLPDATEVRGLEHAIHYQPCALAGGDYYDLVTLSRHYPEYPDTLPEVVGCMIADVSGHGAGAAMETVQFDAILRTYQGQDGLGPAGALTYANRHYFSRRPRGRFMTVLGLLLHPLERRVRYCSAGHPPFIRVHAGQLDVHGRAEDLPLGILREHRFQERELPWQPGDLYVLLTDGITEARDAGGREFGFARVVELVREHLHRPAAAIRDQIVAAVHAHQGGPVGRDDQTLLVLRLGRSYHSATD